MKPLALTIAVSTLVSVSSQAAITGQWDFNTDLTATVGQPIFYLDPDTQAGTAFGTTASFGIPDIAGASAQVMKFPKTPAGGGYGVTVGAAGNGGGAFVNQYTIIMDVLFPAASSNKRRTLFDLTFGGVTQYAVQADNGIGTGVTSHGQLAADQWHRIAFGVDLTTNPGTIDKYINGVKVGTERFGGLDSAFALTDIMYFISDDIDETELGYINSLQIRDEKLTDGLIAALGGATANGILTGPPPNPYIASISPSPDTVRIPSRSTVPPNPQIRIVVEDGETKPLAGSFVLKLDNNTVTPNVSTVGTTTTITYTPPALLAALSIHTVSLTFSDTSTPAKTLGTTWDFAVGPFTPITGNVALPVNTAGSPGFVARTVQGPAYINEVNNPANLPATVLRGIQQLNGTLKAQDGTLVADESTPNPGGGPYIVDGSLNFATDAEVGYFVGDQPFPGIPGQNGHTTQFTTEFVGYLELTAGVHKFGVTVNAARVDVNDDDNFAFYVGKNPRDAFAQTLASYVRFDAPSFEENSQNHNEFTFFAPETGLYPVRLVYIQSGRQGSLELYSVNLETGERLLVNDTANANSIKAYRDSTATTAGTPFIAEVSPKPGTSGNDPGAPIEILIDDDKTQVAAGSIQLTYNGAAVTPTVNKVGSRTTVTYRPNATRTTTANDVRIVYKDTAATQNTITTDFSFGNSVNTQGSRSIVRGEWNFDSGNLDATVGRALEYFDGAGGQTQTGTRFGTTTSFGLPDIDGAPALVMEVPGQDSNAIGYKMYHGITANGGGQFVNQYTLIMDVYLDPAEGGNAASLIQIDSLANTGDGDVFFQGNNFGQGGGGYVGTGQFTPGAWHRVAMAVDLATSPGTVTKYVDGIKQHDWRTDSVDGRRALRDFGILFADGDADERRKMWVNAVQVREGKLSDAQLAFLGGPSSTGIPNEIPESNVKGQWDFNLGNLAATAGRDLEYFDGAGGQTQTGTRFGTTTEFGLPGINGQEARVMEVPGQDSNAIGYKMYSGIAANGGGQFVNQYTIVMDVYLDPAEGGNAASLIQTDSLANTGDGDIFFQGNNFGQGGGGYVGTGHFTPGAWHRVAWAVDLSTNPGTITKYVDGIKQHDWRTDSPDGRRALREFSVLFGDGDADERRKMWVNAVQVREGKLSDAQLAFLGGPEAAGIPIIIPATTVKGQWEFDLGNLAATAGRDLEYFDGAGGQTQTGTRFGTTTEFGLPGIDGQEARVMEVPGQDSNAIGYKMYHGIAGNGGGSFVNQYTLIMDVYLDPAEGGNAASLIQLDSLANTGDGDIFFQGNNFGQGGGGYVGTGHFTPGAWHRVAWAVDLATVPGTVTKYVDGIKQHDWRTDSVDGRRALRDFGILFADGDADERRKMWVNSVQVREGKLSDAQLALLGGPEAAGIPIVIPATTVKSQWDFDLGNLAATAGRDLECFDGAGGATQAGTRFGTTTEFGLPDIGGIPARVMEVPGQDSNAIGYKMYSGIAANGGGNFVNRYTLIMDVYLDPAEGGNAASLIQIDSLANTGDGDIFFQGNNFGQGGGGYVGTGIFNPGAWHRVAWAADLTTTPGTITKFVDGVKQDDWRTDSVDGRRALREFSVLFGDGDADERRKMWVNSVQVREGKLSDADLVALGGPSAFGIPILIPTGEEEIPEILFTFAGGRVTLSWPNAPGFTLETTLDLNNPNWQPAINVTGTSVSFTIADEPHRFFRLKK